MPLSSSATQLKPGIAWLFCLPLLGACNSNDRAGMTDEARIGLYFEGALGYFYQGDLDRAQQQVQFGLRLDEDNERLLLVLGDIHQARGKTADIQAAEAIFRAHPAQHDYRVRLGLGKALERMGILYEDAAAAIRSGDRTTNALDPAKRADELEVDAKEAWEESRTCYLATLEIRFGDVQATGGLVRVCALMGDEAESVRWGREYIEILKSSSRVRRLELEDATLAADRERELRVAMASNDDSIIKTRLHISTIYTRQGKLQEAVDELGAVIAINPDLPQAYSRRAQLYFDLAQYQRASDTLQSFLKLSAHLPFDDPDIRQAYTLLRRCKDALSAAGLVSSK
jgi:Tfp pilus assembly protein PilF